MKKWTINIFSKLFTSRIFASAFLYISCITWQFTLQWIDFYGRENQFTEEGREMQPNYMEKQKFLEVYNLLNNQETVWGINTSLRYRTEIFSIIIIVPPNVSVKINVFFTFVTNSNNFSIYLHYIKVIQHQQNIILCSISCTNQMYQRLTDCSDISISRTFLSTPASSWTQCTLTMASKRTAKSSGLINHCQKISGTSFSWDVLNM